MSGSSEKRARTGRTVLIIVLVVIAIVALVAIAYLATSGGLTGGSSSDTEAAEAAMPADDVTEDLARVLSGLAVTSSEDDRSYDDGYDDEDAYDDDEGEEESTSSDTIDEFLDGYGTFEEATVSGTDSDVFDLPVDDGPMLISIEFEGVDEDSYLDVCTLDADGNIVDIYASITGTTYSGVWTNAVYESYEEDTATQVQVWADGDWTITFSPLNTMEALENGKTYTSSGVYYIDDEDLESLEIVYEITDPDDSGGCNFYFDIVSADDFDYVSIYEESLQTTLEWDGSQPTFVVIDTEGGEWSISW